MKNRFTKPDAFCETLPWSIKNIEWFDRTGVIKLDDDRRAEITLCTFGTQEHYECFAVRILSKTHGEITKHTFQFREYLDANKRSDDRQQSDPSGTCYAKYEVNANIGWGWFIAIPADVKPLTKAIERWIENYQ